MTTLEGRMLAMMKLAEDSGRRPKSWVISRLVDRQLKRESYERVPFSLPILKLYGLPVAVDVTAAVGWGLVVE